MIKKIIPHITIILTLMIITLLILNYLNPLMGFLTRDISKAVIILWILSLVATAIYVIIGFMNKNEANA